MEIPEYFVYCGIFITQSWGKRSGQIAKGELLEDAKVKSRPAVPFRTNPSGMALSAHAVFHANGSAPGAASGIPKAVLKEP